MELYYDVEANGEMHHNPAKNVLWVAREPQEIAAQLGTEESVVRLTIVRAKEKMLAARLPRPTPYIDKTLYASWNAMFVSAYFDSGECLARRVGLELPRIRAENGGSHAARSVVRERKDSRIASAGRRLMLRSTIRFLACWRCSMPTKRRWTRNISARRSAPWTSPSKSMATPKRGGFFDRSSDAPPMGGLDVRRKPFQDSPTPGANSVAAIALIRMHAFTNDAKYQQWAQKTLEAFAGIAPQYGMFAATYGLAATLFAHHPAQVVIVGPANDATANALGSRRKFCFSLWQVGAAHSAGRHASIAAVRAPRNLAALAEGQSARAGLLRQYLLSAHQRSRATESIAGGQAKHRGCRLVPRNYFFGRDSGGTIPLMR